MTNVSPPFDQYLATQPPLHHPLLHALHEFLLTVEPTLTNSIKWKNLIYAKPGGKDQLAVVTHSAHLNLQFWRGVELDDPEGLLEGTGKSIRHVKFRSPEELTSRQDAIRALVQHHLDLPA